jgi:hypothetical protein
MAGSLFCDEREKVRLNHLGSIGKMDYALPKLQSLSDEGCMNSMFTGFKV